MPETVSIEDMRIYASDGYALAASLYLPPKPRAALLISSGTGYPKAFYNHFAIYGAQRGYACLTYDYRGIGGSEPEDMRASPATMLDWGSFDARAGLDALAARFPGLPLFTLGHSYGGQLVGLMANQHLARAHALIAVGNGFWMRHWPSEWHKEFLFFFVTGALSLWRHGYLRGGQYWPGSNMPGPVFSQWRRWCLSPQYYRKDIDRLLGGAYFDAVTAPIRHFGFIDDPIVNHRSIGFTRSQYKNAPFEEVWVDPKTLGLSGIGHSGAFARKAKAFWPQPFDWFDQNL